MADAPTLKDASGNAIDPTVQDYIPPTIEITGVEDQTTSIEEVDENNTAVTKMFLV